MGADHRTKIAVLANHGTNTQNLRKRVLKWHQCYLQHLGDDRLSHTLTTICRWLGIVEKSRKLRITYKYCHKLKKHNAKYGLPPAKDAETLTPWHTVCVYLIGTYTILAKVRQRENKILTKEIHRKSVV